MDLGLTDRVCVVTGGSRGIGLDIARRLVDEGGHAMLVGRGEDALRAAAAELGDRAAWVSADLMAADAGERVLAACTERFGRADVLVNNAGMMDVVGLEDQTDDDYLAQFTLHVLAPRRLMHALVPPMAQRGWGRVVNLGSSAGRRPSARNLAYGVSKAAELALSRGYAEHYAARGVAVNAVNPGPLAGSMWLDPGGLADQSAELFQTTREQVLERVTESLPRRQMGTPAEIADVVVFLCSERAANMVGAAVSVDGGAVRSIF